MDDRHKTPRIYASGAQKRKLKVDRDNQREEKRKKNDDSEPRKLNIENTNTIENEPIVEQEISKTFIGFENDVGIWPQNSTNEMITYWIKQGSKHLQNCDKIVLETKSVQQDRVDRSAHNTRKCSIHFFKRITKNKEVINRNWLCFSPTTGKLYCYICKLLGIKSGKLSSDGFCDWKHAAEKLSQHETSKHHLEAILALNHRERKIGCLDHQLQKQIAELSSYWRKVLKRVVSTIKFIAERGLAFRGDNEIIGSPRNGNYLGILELVAEFDPLLSAHIRDHANKKSGHTNYLSSTICEELIDLMAKEVLGEIITRIKKSKYYFVSVDSTPDEAHIDQLTIVVRYMEEITPVERFLTFVPNCGHTGIEMANTLITFLDYHKIELNDCRGQSYDNAANMSGKYQGMQALIKNKNEFAEFVPCCGHSLNLVGKTAANSCVAAIRFFDFIQNLYVFFTATPTRYALLTKKLACIDKNKRVYVLKNLNETRWSCRADATKAVVFGYDFIKEALEEISNDLEQKDIVKIESKKLNESMCTLEVAFYAIFWNDILERFDLTSHLLQDPKIVLQTAVNALNSLLSFVQEIRNKYEEYEEKAKQMSGLKDQSRFELNKK
ncbi:zinc finger MYM-type protein 1-like [Myzus persicae]|uniref:zinc finger MYM-type protein 1-like n=1 Tax=Myzus persicae TaxID=13164 RepID=UPI000B931DC5|nr:zinc finger MYM-type protein 1-like [Myzus persicae]